MNRTARPALLYPRAADTQTGAGTGDGAGLSHADWLATLKRGDLVRIRTHTGETMPPAMVTNETPCYVFIGKLKFHRRHGWQVSRQGNRVYRMKLRLVRDEMELQ